jgi:hypothetical protein
LKKINADNEFYEEETETKTETKAEVETEINKFFLFLIYDSVSDFTSLIYIKSCYFFLILCDSSYSSSSVITSSAI